MAGLTGYLEQRSTEKVNALVSDFQPPDFSQGIVVKPPKILFFVVFTIVIVGP